LLGRQSRNFPKNDVAELNAEYIAYQTKLSTRSEMTALVSDYPHSEG
jgi:hypothetical protein